VQLALHAVVAARPEDEAAVGQPAILEQRDRAGDDVDAVLAGETGEQLDTAGISPRR
jgi:hypothetical protein